MNKQNFAFKGDHSCGRLALDTIKGQGFALTKGPSDNTQLTMRQAKHGRHDLSCRVRDYAMLLNNLDAVEDAATAAARFPLSCSCMARRSA